MLVSSDSLKDPQVDWNEMEKKTHLARTLRFFFTLLLLWGFIEAKVCSASSFPVSKIVRGAAGVSAIPPEKVCHYYASDMEKTHGIPDKLLTAVSLTESGRSTVKGLVSWPWTLNAEGKGYYFSTKTEAILAVQRLQAKGITSIDVGCMQINLHHHPQAFSSLEEAFDPAANVAYGANFLKTLQKSHKNWAKAVAHYHSATPSVHLAYQNKVLKTWLEEKQKKTTLFSQRRYPLYTTSPRAFFGRTTSRTLRRTASPPPPAWVKKHTSAPNLSQVPEVQRISSQAVYQTRGKKIMKTRSLPTKKDPLSKGPSWLLGKASEKPLTP
ncbi:MAG: lytic transglycosylase domain-containing protein [Alphaproteobacteria bacterium]